MNKVQYAIGMHIFYNNVEYIVVRQINFQEIMAQNISTGEKAILSIQEMTKESQISNQEDNQQDINPLELSSHDWDEANKRLEIIKPILGVVTNRIKAIKQRAAEYNLHPSTIYRWLEAYKNSGNLLASIAPKNQAKGGRGRLRTVEEVELIIKKTIEELYLSKQKYSSKKTYMAIVQRCKNAKIKPPSENTVRSRIQSLSDKEVLKRRESARMADRKYRNTDGMFPAGKYPLDFIQIDHTPMDIIVVDEVYGQPIGRPYLTIAMDIYSRMVMGFFISLDEPSYFSVSQCLTQAMLSKEKYLRSLEVDGEWNIWGIPKTIGLDNAAEFRGKDLQRVCEHYGIELNWRPVARPQFGGHIERIIGTAMREVHTLPGTTFSNIQQRGEYKSEKYATMTLKSLEKWLTEYIINVYHKQIHSGINCTPEHKYEIGIFGDGKTSLGRGLPERIADEDKFKISLLPTIERTIQQSGIKIDSIQYYADALRRWIRAKDKDKKARKFIFKRDLRDISTIWFYDPEIKEYYPIPFRNISYPPISVWDLRAIKKYLDDNNVTGYDEVTIFSAYEKMKQIEKDSAQKVKSIRRKHSAQKHRDTKRKFDNIPKTKSKSNSSSDAENDISLSDLYKDIEPFDDIEIL